VADDWLAATDAALAEMALETDADDPVPAPLSSAS
jgi:hypothetical protein